MCIASMKGKVCGGVNIFYFFAACVECNVNPHSRSFKLVQDALKLASNPSVGNFNNGQNETDLNSTNLSGIHTNISLREFSSHYALNAFNAWSLSTVKEIACYLQVHFISSINNTCKCNDYRVINLCVIVIVSCWCCCYCYKLYYNYRFSDLSWFLIFVLIFNFMFHAISRFGGLISSTTWHWIEGQEPKDGWINNNNNKPSFTTLKVTRKKMDLLSYAYLR